MPSIADQLEEAAFERQIEADRLAAKEARDANVELAAFTVLLVAELRKTAPNDRKSPALQLAAAAAMVNRLRPEFAGVYRRLRERNERMLGRLAQNEAAHLQKAVAATAGAGLLWRPLTEKQAQAVAADLNILGEPLGEWWTRQRISVRREYIQQMRLGLIDGEDLDTLVARVQGTPAQRRQGGLMRRARRHVETLVNTSMHAIRQQARTEVYRKHPEVVTHLQALNEAPVSDICQSRAGEVWPVAEAPSPPPWHPNCKTTLIPIVRRLSALEQEKLPARVKEDLRQAAQDKRVGLDGQPAAGLTPEAIFKKMPRAQAVKLLGQGRLKLFEEGKLNFKQLVDQTGRPRTLKELEALAKDSQA